jgi:uncharacterized protein YuzB (UPF0349 family)
MAKIDLNYDALDALLQFKVSLSFCADYLGVSRDTIMRRIKEDHGLSFAEYHALKKERTATKLQQKAIELALSGNNVMMIFCLKNLAGWSDKKEVDLTSASKIEIHERDKDL